MKIIDDLQCAGNPARAVFASRFFKTGPDGYAKGDIFLGVSVPNVRQIARAYRDLSLVEIKELLLSPIHECRLAALVILNFQFARGDAKTRTRVYTLYLKSTKRVNNWDLVDISAPKIVGAYLCNQPRTILTRLARSKNLWERRIAIVATFAFIQRGHITDTLKLAKILLRDPHDLIHKAVGWMLREVEKKDQAALEKFLNMHASVMPRTMLRYAIERLPQPKKQHYLTIKRRAVY